MASAPYPTAMGDEDATHGGVSSDYLPRDAAYADGEEIFNEEGDGDWTDGDGEFGLEDNGGGGGGDGEPNWEEMIDDRTMQLLAQSRALISEKADSPKKFRRKRVARRARRRKKKATATAVPMPPSPAQRQPPPCPCRLCSSS